MTGIADLEKASGAENDKASERIPTQTVSQEAKESSTTGAIEVTLDDDEHPFKWPISKSAINIP